MRPHFQCSESALCSCSITPFQGPVEWASTAAQTWTCTEPLGFQLVRSGRGCRVPVFNRCPVDSCSGCTLVARTLMRLHSTFAHPGFSFWVVVKKITTVHSERGRSSHEGKHRWPGTQAMREAEVTELLFELPSVSSVILWWVTEMRLRGWAFSHCLS